MMLKAEITGDTHPKEVTIVSDDKEAENGHLVDGLAEAEWNDLATGCIRWS